MKNGSQYKAVWAVILTVMLFCYWLYIRQPVISNGQLAGFEYASLVRALERRGETTSTNIIHIELLKRSRVRVWTQAASGTGGEVLTFNKGFGWWRVEKEGMWLE
ncbi:MAG: hypothetical protein H7A46_20830 [Verrucomicrobiales bacterium]|nr:hypothetical protein [Verrucomicrobiales bacterium]